MQTQCPDCRTVFRVSEAQLQAAHGLVRCGECDNVFNASAALLETPIRDPGAGHDGWSFTPAPERASARFFLHDLNAEQRQRGAQRRWIVLATVLVLALSAQLVYGQRDRLAYLPGMRPLLEAMCAQLGCRLQPPRDLSKIALLNRNVYSHPNAPGALIISATIINNGSFTQSFPVLAVTMANVRGSTVAQRDFAPRDYLSATDAAAGMTPGVPVSIALQVVDPGSDAMSFELDFR